MEKILNKKGRLVAIKSSSFKDGVTPITVEEEAIQVLSIKRKAGHLVKPHLHTKQKRETQVLQECLVVISGKLRVHFFDEVTQEEFACLDVGSGETCVTLEGPHSIEFLEDTEVVEVKNGPFIEDRQDFPQS